MDGPDHGETANGVSAVNQSDEARLIAAARRISAAEKRIVQLYREVETRSLLGELSTLVGEQAQVKSESI